MQLGLYTKYFIALFFAFFLNVQASVSVDAASPYGSRSGTDAEDAVSGSVGSYSPPPVYVTKIDLTAGSSDPLFGTFNILNNADDTIGDLRYRIELLEALPVAKENELVEDNGRMYDSVLSSDVLALIPGEEKAVPFTYNPPKVPAGGYRMRIQITTSQGRDLGWDDTSVTLSGSSDSFVDLVPGTILLPEFPTQQDIHPLSGPNVSPASSFTLRATAKNSGATSVTVTPSLSIYDFATSGAVISTTPSTPVVLAQNKDVPLDIAVTAPTTPGVYYGELTLNVGETRVSPIAQYRFVVRGSSAHIISARIKELHTKTNENVHVVVEYAGPADAETALKATLHIDILDTAGVAVTFQVAEPLELNDAIGGGVAQVPLTRDLVSTPGLKVTLTGEDGAVLDTYDVAIPLTSEQLKSVAEKKENQREENAVVGKGTNKKLAMYVFVGILLIGLLFLVLYMHKKKHSSAIPLGLLFMIATSFTVVQGVLAAGNGSGIEVVNPLRFGEPASGYRGGTWEIAFGNKPVVEVFINKPIHDRPAGTYTQSAVPFAYRIEYGVCKNYIPKARVIARFDKNGGKHSNLTGSSSSDWFELINRVINNRNCSGYYCLEKISGRATLNLTVPGAPLEDTTLQIAGFWNEIEELSGVPQEIDPNNWHITSRHAHVVNLWVNSPNRAPVAIAKASINQGVYSPNITVTQGVPVNVRVTGGQHGGTGSSDPDGWNDPNKGISSGGKCEVNSDLNTGAGVFETTILSPATPESCDMNLGTIVFTQDPGAYVYEVIRYTDAAGGVSNVGTITVTVATNPNPPVNTAPVAVAKMSIDNGLTYSSDVTVTQGASVNVRLTAGYHGSAGSYDADGWKKPGIGVEGGGKCEWNSDLNLGPATYETTKINPIAPISCDVNLGTKVFTKDPGTYTYNLLKITDAGGAFSNTGTVKLTVTPAIPTSSNRPPFTIAKMSIDNGVTYSPDVTVTQGKPVHVRITGGEHGSGGSFDPDGWDTVDKGVSSGGKCEVNSVLEPLPGDETFETTILNPAFPSTCDKDLGQITFTQEPGVYTYQIIKYTDAGGLRSNIGAVDVTVKAPDPNPNSDTEFDSGDGLIETN